MFTKHADCMASTSHAIGRQPIQSACLGNQTAETNPRLERHSGMLACVGGGEGLDFT